jgi:hypothetical protein
MRRISTFAMAALLAAGLSGVAQEKKQAPPSNGTISFQFAAVDTNMDKKISKAEWEAYFVKLDKNNDGFLTEDEFLAAAREAKQRSKDGGK